MCPWVVPNVLIRYIKHVQNYAPLKKQKNMNMILNVKNVLRGAKSQIILRKIKITQLK